MMPITCTVALCTNNHADRLARTLEELRQLQSPKAAWELPIIGNGCTDSTPSLLGAHRWPDGWHVRIVREEKLGLSKTRNCAIREAAGGYLIFIDNDETSASRDRAPCS